MMNPQLAFLAPFLLLFGQVRAGFAYVSRFIFWRDDFAYDVGAEVEMWLRDNCKLLPHLTKLDERVDGNVKFGGYRGHERPKALVLFPAQSFLVFVKSWWCPIPYLFSLNDNSLRYFVGTFPRKKLWEHLGNLKTAQLKRSLVVSQEEESNPTGGGYRVVYLSSGKSGSSSPNTPEAGSSPLSIRQALFSRDTNTGEPSAGSLANRYFDRWILDPDFRGVWSRYLPHVYREVEAFPEKYAHFKESREEDERKLPFGKEKELLESDVRQWLRMRDWCESRSLPWRRGGLLYGPPGTGKSAMIREVALQFKLPVYIIDLSQCTNAFLQSLLEDSNWDWPAIFLFEDIDGVFNGREYVAPRSMLQDPVTFDALLQFVGGAVVLHGVYVIMTTNHVEKLDDALIRKGRVDLKMEVRGCTKDHIRKLCDHVFFDDKATADLMYGQLEEGTPVAEVSMALRDKAAEILNQKIINHSL
jgi:hypothetical protein